MENRPPGPDADTLSKDDDNESEDKRGREARSQRRIPMRSLREIIDRLPEQASGSHETKKPPRGIFGILAEDAARSDKPADSHEQPSPAEKPISGSDPESGLVPPELRQNPAEHLEEDDDDEEESSSEAPSASSPKQSDGSSGSNPDIQESYPNGDTESEYHGAHIEADAASDEDGNYTPEMGVGLDSADIDQEPGTVEPSAVEYVGQAANESTETPGMYIPDMREASADAGHTSVTVPPEAPSVAWGASAEGGGGSQLPPIHEGMVLPTPDGSAAAYGVGVEAGSPISATLRGTESAVPRHGHGVDGLLAVGLVAEHFIAKGRNEKTRRQLQDQIDDVREHAAQEQIAFQKLHVNTLGQREQLSGLRQTSAEQVIQAQKSQDQMRKDLQELQQQVVVQADLRTEISSSPAPAEGATTYVSAIEQQAVHQNAGNRAPHATERVASYPGPERPPSRAQDVLSTNLTPSEIDIPAPEVVVTQAKEAEVEKQKQEVMQRMVMEQSKTAAEHDVPVERSYERRSEVRDDPGPTGGTGGDGGALSVPPVVSPDDYPQSIGNPHSTYQQDIHNGANAEDPAYRSAVVGGFAGALVVLVLGLIAYFMLR